MGKHEQPQTESIDIYSSSTAGPKKKKDKRKKKKKTVGQKVAIALLSVLLSICVIVSGLLIFAVNYFKYNRTDIDHGELAVNSEDSEEHIINIALFGIDTRKTTSMKGLSDSIMILSVNKDTKQIKLISIMRDSVTLVNEKRSKINAAYSKGGPELAIKTINENFDMDITDYATVNFVGMADLVDAVGGVEVAVTQGELGDKGHGVNAQIREQAILRGLDPNKYTIKKAGIQTLGGIQAVSWARIRYQPTAEGERDDYGRTARQRTVMTQLFEKAKSMNVLEIPGFVKKALPYVETSLTYNEIIGLAVPVLSGGVLETARIPHDGTVISGRNGGVTGGVYYNLDYATAQLKAFIYDNVTFEEYVTQHQIDKTGW